jgi:valyl-tRNA synthetase
MQLLHPFMPFITEELYHLLAERKDDLCIRQFEVIKPANQSVLNTGKLLRDAITAIRDARNKAQLKPKTEIVLHIQPAAENNYKLIEALLGKQVNAKAIYYTGTSIANSIAVVLGKDKFYIESEQPLQNGNQKEDLLKEKEHLQGFLLSVEKKLSNEKFVQNAKAEVIELEKKKKADAEAKLKIIEESLTGL